MIKRVLFIFVLFSLHILLVNSANIDINSCQALTTGNTYIVTSGFSATGNCLTLPNTPFDIIIDLGGYTMTGNGTGYGIYFLGGGHDRNFNLTIRNGEISNFNRGIYMFSNGFRSNLNLTMENIDFSSNVAYDNYIDMQGAGATPFATVSGITSSQITYFRNFNNITMSDFDSTSELSFLSVGDVILTDVDTTGRFSVDITDNLYLYDTGDGIMDVDTFFLDTITNIHDYVDFQVSDLCGSSYTGSISGLEVKMSANSSDTGTCFVLRHNSDITIDMNGYTISGDDGATDYGFSWLGSTHDTTSDFTIKNGIIKDFGRGISFFSNGFRSNLNSAMDNITFISNSGYDFYIDMPGTPATHNITISKINSSKHVYLDDMSNLTLIDFSTSDILQIVAVENLLLDDTDDGIMDVGSFNFNDIFNIVNNIDFSVEDICSSSYTGSLPGLEVKMSANSSDTGTCFVLRHNTDITIDMNGYTISGDDGATDYGFSWVGSTLNTTSDFTIKNGIIKDFGRGISFFSNGFYSNVDYLLDNITFISNSGYDFYIDMPGTPATHNITISKINSSKHVYLDDMSNLTLIDFSTSDILQIVAVENLLLDDTDDGIMDVNVFTFSSISNIVNNVDFSVGNICGSSYTGTLSGFEIKMSSDSSDTGTCFTFRHGSYITLDMNGYTISGDDGASDYGFYSLMGAHDASTDINIKNGIIEDFGRGVYLYSNGFRSYANLSLENITFVSNSGHDIYLDLPGAGAFQYVDMFNIRNSGAFYIKDVTNVTMFGNNLTTATHITRTGTTDLDVNYNPGAGAIGNFWQDFTCDDESNFHIVTYGDYNYTICDENNYSVNSILDENPVIGIGLATSPPVGGGGSESGSGLSSIFPYSGNGSMIAFLAVFIIFSFLF